MPLRVCALLLASLAALGLGACGHRGSGARSVASPDVPGANIAHGKAVYARECEACHGREGSGGQIGPSLANERARRSYEAVRAFVLNPQPLMPKLYPSRLTLSDVRDVSAYVESL